MASISELNQLFGSYFDWKLFLNKFLETYDSKERLNNEDKIIVMGRDYFTNLKTILDEYHSNETKHNTLKLKIIFHLIKFSLPLLSKDYRNQFSAIGEALTGTMVLERWKTCIEHTDSVYGFGYAITKMFLRAIPNNSKKFALKLIRSIKKSFVNNFPNIKWMDKETRKLAEEKVNSVVDLIGYPDFIDDENALNERYKLIYVDEDDYFGNEIRLIQYALKSEILTYRKPVNKAE